MSRTPLAAISDACQKYQLLLGPPPITTASIGRDADLLYLPGVIRELGASWRPILSVVTHPHEQEAGEWVAKEIERLRNLSYDDLAALEGEPEHEPRETADHAALVLETQVFWDDGERRNLRVMVDVWDPSKRISRSIAKDDFIRAPDGSFVGE